jgi:ABC-2 type transport system ATP-binding protein/lipopolysaccharide transport system ATP-binding protein
LIIDEVIAVGDEEFQRKCFDHLADLRRRGVTIVVVTHGMATVETMCDGAAWLDHGVLQQEGPAADIASAYLRRVNEHERAERQADAVAAAEAATAMGDEPEIDPQAVSEAWFGEDIEILDVWFADGAGDAVSTGTTGEPLTVNISYRAHRSVEDPVFGYMIHTENDTPVAGSNTRLSGIETGLVDGDGVLAIKMDQLQLLPGNYEFTIGINDKFVQHTYDRHYRSHPLAVRRGNLPIGVGFVDLDVTWVSASAGSTGQGES